MSDLQTAWKLKADQKSITVTDMVSYALIKAIRAKSNDKLEVVKGLLYRSFTPISNKNKLETSKPFAALEKAIRITPFVGIFGEEFLNKSEKQQVKELLLLLSTEKFEDITYTYIFTRQDISPEQQLVQTAHCTMVLGQHVNKHEHNANRLHFVVFGTKDHNDLTAKRKLTEMHGVKTIEFIEPDLDNTLTSFACLPMRKSVAQRKKIFNDCQLLVIS